jgi:uncharacterized protein
MYKKEPFYERAICWDIMILCVIAIDLALLYAVIVWTAGIAEWVTGAILLIDLGLVLYGSFIEPRFISLNTKNVHILPLPAIKIGIVADFHVGPYKQAEFVQKSVDLMNAQKPDIIFVVGDFLFDYHADLSSLAPLQKLKAPLGVIAVMGNHDSGDHVTFGKRKFRTMDRTGEITSMLKTFGWTVLRDESITIDVHGKKIAIAGVDKSWKELMDMKTTLENVPTGMPLILLSHSPDVILLDAHQRAALIVSGHTHGGQMRLPLIGSLAPIPSELGRAYDRGIFTLKSGTILAITQGVGETMARARLFCPPEIMMLEVNREGAKVDNVEKV